MNVKYLYILMWAITLSMMIFWLTLEVDAEESVEQLVVRVAEDYSREQGFNWQCSINWTPVTLAQFIYWLGIAEGWFKKWWAWYRTNNVGSLRKWMWLKNVVRTEHIDNSKTRPVYETMYDWLYEKTHLVASDEYMYKCNYTWKTALCYTAWCKANPDDVMASWVTKWQNATNHMNNALSAAKKLSVTVSNAWQVVVKEHVVEFDLWKDAKKEEEKLAYWEEQLRKAQENVDAHTKRAQQKRNVCKWTKWCKE